MFGPTVHYNNHMVNKFKSVHTRIINTTTLFNGIVAIFLLIWNHTDNHLDPLVEVLSDGLKVRVISIIIQLNPVYFDETEYWINIYT